MNFTCMKTSGCMVSKIRIITWPNCVLVGESRRLHWNAESALPSPLHISGFEKMSRWRVTSISWGMYPAGKIEYSHHAAVQVYVVRQCWELTSAFPLCPQQRRQRRVRRNMCKCIRKTPSPSRYVEKPHDQMQCRIRAFWVRKQWRQVSVVSSIADYSQWISEGDEGKGEGGKRHGSNYALGIL